MTENRPHVKYVLVYLERSRWVLPVASCPYRREIDENNRKPNQQIGSIRQAGSPAQFFLQHGACLELNEIDTQTISTNHDTAATRTDSSPRNHTQPTLHAQELRFLRMRISICAECSMIAGKTIRLLTSRRRDLSHPSRTTQN